MWMVTGEMGVNGERWEGVDGDRWEGVNGDR